MSHGPRWRDYLSWAGGIVSGLVLALTAVSVAGPTARAGPAEVLTEAQGGTRLSPTRWPTGPSRRCWATATSSLLTARNFAQLAVRGSGTNPHRVQALLLSDERAGPTSPFRVATRSCD